MPNEGSEQRINLDHITIPDIVMIGCIVVLSAVLILKTGFGFSWFSGRQKDSGASVYHEGKLLQHISLAGDRNLELLEGKMLLEVKEGRLRIKRSDCPRQVCVQMGWIRPGGEAIICVPYKIVIEIGSDHAASLDAVVF